LRRRYHDIVASRSPISRHESTFVITALIYNDIFSLGCVFHIVEQQILEQKKRKEDEQRRWKDDTTSGHWAERTAMKQQAVLPSGGGYHYAPDPISSDVYNAASVQERRVNSAPENTQNTSVFGDTYGNGVQGVQQQEVPR